MKLRRQRGLTTVEFAIVGAVSLTILIGCIEIGRMFFVWNSLAEATRRAARLAAVCLVGSPNIKGNAMLSPTMAATASTVLPGLTTANITVTYLDDAGAATTVQANMRFVTAEITGYAYTLFIPYITPVIMAPPFKTTVPVESLGYIPETKTYVCMGS